jgi:hypothetical protein
MSHDHTTTYHYYPGAGAQSIDNQYPHMTPARTPRKMVGRVEFDPASNTIYRPARDDELDVIQHFAHHASHCPRCEDPFRVYVNSDTLCDRSHAYARDVAQYLSSKAGKAYSVIDRNATDGRVQIEIPPRCDAVRGLLKALDQGLKISSQKLSTVVSHDRTYPVPERRRLLKQRDGYYVLEVAPRRREERERVKGGDQRCDIVYVKESLYDEEERRRRRREQGKPVIVDAEPRWNETYHR